FGFDEAINYSTTDDMKAAIAATCPDGVDVYYDNVAGAISDSVHTHMNKFGRIVNCGAISTYNATAVPTGPRVEPFLIKNSALMEGFIVGNYASIFSEATDQLSQWLRDDKLTYTETVIEGFDNIPNAFFGLFEGKNKGKMIVK